MHVLRSRVLFVAVAAMGLLAADSFGAVGAPPPNKVQFEHPDPFANSRFVTLVGEKYTDACRFHPPDLEVGPLGPPNLSMRQIDLDYSTCTSRVEIGVPTVSSNDEAGRGGSAESEPASHVDRARSLDSGSANLRGGRSAARNARRPQATLDTTTSGAYRVWFEDPAGADLTETKARLIWSYNGSCTYGGSASGHWWWQSWTGWNLDDPYSNAWLTGGGCGNSYYAHADGGFWNTAVCGYIVHTFAEDVRFRGGYAGGYGGQVGSAWNSSSCFTLHWEAGFSA